MERTPVTSSNVRAIGYDASVLTLEVEFLNGSIYHYHDCPPEVHRELMQAPSKGTYLNDRIKPNYRYTKVA